MVFEYDVIVVGAGPAGLSVASELSREFKVLVIDKKVNASDTDKSWFIPTFIADGIDEVQPFLYGGVKKYITNTFSGMHTSWDGALPGGYSYVREHEILQHWADNIKKNGSKIILECQYRDHDTNDEGAKVVTSKGDFYGRLVIDASGSDSLISKKYEYKHDDYYWWSIMGCITEHDDLGDMKDGDYMFWGTFEDTNTNTKTSLRDGRPVFEYEVLEQKNEKGEGNNLVFPLILYLRKEKVDFDVMKDQFIDILRKEESTQAFHDEEKVRINEWKYGWYPSGGQSQRIAEDRVAFIGDAGCWTTPCGWGFAFILRNYQRYAANLTQALLADTCDAESLKDIIKLDTNDKHQILLDRIAMHFLSNANTEQLDRFINFFDKTDSLICEKVFTLTITHEDMIGMLDDFLEEFSLFELITILPREDYILLLREAKAFVSSWVVDSIETLLEKLHIKEKEADHGGFDFE